MPLETLRSVFESSPLAVIAVDAEGCVTLWNQGAERLFGWPAAETVGRTPPIPLAAGEHALVRKDGSRLEASLWAAPLAASGGSVVIAADLSGSSQAVRFQHVFEATADAILKVDRAGRVVLANSSAEKMFGYSAGALAGERIEALIPERFRHSHPEHRRQYDAQPVMRPMGSGLDLWARRSDGVEFPADVNLCPVEGEEAGVVCTIRDMTDRKRIEGEIRALNQHLTRSAGELVAANKELQLRNREVERADRLKSEFLASMSHELRTPLNAIIGFSDLLAEQTAGPVNEKQKRFVAHIQQGARHLLELINDILDLSKIEAGRLELHREKFPLEGALGEVLATIRPLAMAKHLTVLSSLQPDVALYADRVRFKQMLYNLISNAVKFTPERGKVEIEARCEDGWVLTTVADTGVGIAPEDHAAIFEAFRQVGATTKGVKEGTGLGLAITRRLVEDHGGAIWVKSAPGQGSRFGFTLPSGALEQETPGLARVARAARVRPLVLVIDDEAAAQELLARWLEPEGYDVATAVSGPEALARARELHPDVITLNMLTPGKDGWETLHRLKNTAVTAAIPVVIVSVVDEKKVGLALGAADYLVKPVDRQVLLSTMRKHVAPPEAAAPRRVLVVDDDAQARDLVGEALEANGYGVLTASNGREALEALERHAVDAMILDLVMPEVDGFEVLRRVRDNPAWSRVPVFVLTGKDLTAVEAEALRLQTEAWFRKTDAWKDELLREFRKAVRWTGARE